VVTRAAADADPPAAGWRQTMEEEVARLRAQVEEMRTQIAEILARE